jgi:hypothetical protein
MRGTNTYPCRAGKDTGEQIARLLLVITAPLSYSLLGQILDVCCFRLERLTGRCARGEMSLIRSAFGIKWLTQARQMSSASRQIGQESVSCL